jgi:hypothetical protein
MSRKRPTAARIRTLTPQVVANEYPNGARRWADLPESAMVTALDAVDEDGRSVYVRLNMSQYAGETKPDIAAMRLLGNRLLEAADQWEKNEDRRARSLQRASEQEAEWAAEIGVHPADLVDALTPKGEDHERAAIVLHASRDTVARYLPANYSIRTNLVVEDGRIGILVAGKDDHGWTLDGYVIPRLASGLIPAYECDPDTGARLPE